MEHKSKNSNMTTFLVTWFGQVVSLVGSGLTSFALGVWVFERTGSPTLFAYIGLFAVIPKVIFSPRETWANSPYARRSNERMRAISSRRL